MTRHAFPALAVALMAGLLARGAQAAPYEFDYFPLVDTGGGQGPVVEQFPEEQGWARFVLGDVARQIDVAESALSLTATEDLSWEFYTNDDLGWIVAAEDEFLYAMWSIRVLDENVFGDNSLTIGLAGFSGDTTINVGVDQVRDIEANLSHAVEPGEFHTYVLLSTNLADYDLYVDGEYAFSDIFKTPSGFDAYVAWGDGGLTHSSSEWRFFRFGVARQGDVNVDGRVNLTDFATFARCFGASLAVPSPTCSELEAAQSDLNADGVIDLLDFATFAINFSG